MAGFWFRVPGKRGRRGCVGQNELLDMLDTQWSAAGLSTTTNANFSAKSTCRWKAAGGRRSPFGPVMSWGENGPDRGIWEQSIPVRQHDTHYQWEHTNDNSAEMGTCTPAQPTDCSQLLAGAR
jgi:hypothetical protein